MNKKISIFIGIAAFALMVGLTLDAIGFYSNKTNNTVSGCFFVNDMNVLFNFGKILTSTEDNILVGYSQVNDIEEKFKKHPREEWVKMFGNQFVELVEDIKDEDNPIIILYKLKDF
jgi:uncharacterized protein YbcI